MVRTKIGQICVRPFGFVPESEDPLRIKGQIAPLEKPTACLKVQTLFERNTLFEGNRIGRPHHPGDLVGRRRDASVSPANKDRVGQTGIQTVRFPGSRIYVHPQDMLSFD